MPPPESSTLRRHSRRRFDADFQAFVALVGHGVEGIAQQVDQHLFQADRIAAHPGRAGQVQRHLDRFGANARVEQVQRLVDHGGQVQAFAQAAGAVAGEGLQVAGERGHAREHLVQRLSAL
jgi:hypothetical protein